MQLSEKSVHPGSTKWNVSVRPLRMVGLSDGKPGYGPFEFNIYVTDKQGFSVKFGKPNTKSSGKVVVGRPSDLSVGSPYLASLAAMYVATHKCGVSLSHLKENPVTPKQVTSIMRYHVIFTFQRLMSNVGLLAKYLTDDDRRRIFGLIPGESEYVVAEAKTGSTIEHWMGGRDPDVRDLIKDPTYSYSGEYVRTIRYMVRTSVKEGKNDDFLRFVPYESEGITMIGMDLINKSILTYTHCMIGAQSNTEAPIVGMGAASLAAQGRCSELHEHMVKTTDVLNLTKSVVEIIESTKVKVDRDIIIGLARIPSSMLLFEKSTQAVKMENYEDRTEGQDNDETRMWDILTRVGLLVGGVGVVFMRS